MPRLSALVSGAAIVGAACLLSAVAQADVISPEEEACRSKAAGVSCSVRSGGKTVDGACAAATCSRLDYSSWNRDASSSPPTTSYACMQCKAGATPTSAGDEDGGCSVSTGLARTAAPFGLAAIPAVVVALLRRRRR